MITFVLAIIKSLGIKDTAIGVLVVALVFTAAQWHKVSVESKNIQMIYSHPEFKTVEKIVYRTGPVQIKTVIIKEKDGKEITTINETHGANVETTEKGTDNKIVPISVSLAEARSDRYLISAGFNRLSADFEGKALFVGYGIKNRFDIQVGVVQHQDLSPWILTTFRF